MYDLSYYLPSFISCQKVFPIQTSKALVGQREKEVESLKAISLQENRGKSQINNSPDPYQECGVLNKEILKDLTCRAVDMNWNSLSSLL